MRFLILPTINCMLSVFMLKVNQVKKLSSPYLITNILIITSHLEKLRYVEFFTGVAYLNAGAQK